VNTPQTPTPGDWRKGGYRDAHELAPRAPRTPTPFARDLIYAYQGTQSALRTIGGIFLLIGLPVTFFLGGGLPTDFALAATGQPTTATVLATRIVHNVEVNDRHPVEIKYQYDYSEERYEGASYTTHGDIINSATIGATIPVEIFPASPSLSRMKGTTSSQMGYAGVFIFIFPLVGAIMFGWAVRSNRREIRAFRDGVAAKGLVIRRGEDMTTKINGNHPFEVTWEFQVDGTNYKGKLSHMDHKILRRALPDDEVTVLYDPRNPKVNTVWFE
jgi:hypothetical protein